MRRGLAVVFIVLSLAACAENRQQHYAKAVLGRPEPKNQKERIVECGWLEGEIARQQNLGASGSGVSAAPRMAATYRIVTRNNIKVLQTRGAYLRCWPGAFPGAN